MRFEITVRGPERLDEIAGHIREFGFGAVNVTDVSKDSDTVAHARRLLELLPGLDLMLHVAAKHHGARSFSGHIGRATAAGIGSFLLVSGHPRREFDSLAALRLFEVAPRGASAWCVHNPFFGGTRQAEEDRRLERKLACSRLAGVCLQIGVDRQAVRDAAARIRAARPDVEIAGSLPVPSEALVRRLATKLLYGVSLPAGFFLSAKAAEREVRRMRENYRESGITPVIFAFDSGREAFERAAEMREW